MLIKYGARIDVKNNKGHTAHEEASIGTGASMELKNFFGWLYMMSLVDACSSCLRVRYLPVDAPQANIMSSIDFRCEGQIRCLEEK